MVYSDQYKFIFLAVPKTGSRSIQDHLQNYGVRSKTGWDPNHDGYDRVKKKLGEEKCNDYFKIAFFRNPWSLIVSLFFHNRDNHQLPVNKSTIVEWINWYRGDAFTPYLFDKNGNQVLDFIGRLENIDEDLNTACKEIGVPVTEKLSHVGKQIVGGRLHYKSYYDPSLIKKVENIFSKSLDVLEYEF